MGMNDAAQLTGWLIILVFGLLVCVVLRRRGVPITWVRDLLHLGAGVWVFGWPFWSSPAVPICLPVAATLGLLLVPALAPRVPALARLRDSVSDANERWSGLVLYAASFAWLTWMAFHRDAFPAAAGLLALAVADGMGGAVGRGWGRHFFSLPGSKPKSLEGSLTVLVTAGASVWIAALYFHHPLAGFTLFGAALVATLAEAVAPRASDNAVLPAAVWLFLSWRPPGP
jgi:dolichol kinase